MDKNRNIIHVDMDAFYAAIEQRDNPSLRGKPVVVGGSNPHSRGVVSAASYEARKYGIRSAMPLKQAYLRCPHAIFLPVNMPKYKQVSLAIHKIFRHYTEIIEPVSLDEAFLDVTGQDAKRIGYAIKKRIKSQLNLTASVGIAHNKFLAKLASDLEKPDGFTIIAQEDIPSFLAPLPIRRIWGIGPRTEAYLQGMGIFTIGDLQLLERDFLIKSFGKWGNELYNLARGIDHRPVSSKRQPKSIGEETTFATDQQDPEKLRRSLAEFAQVLWQRLEQKGLLGRTITLKVRYSNFVTITRSHTSPDPATSANQIFQRALYLLTKIDLKHQKVRLIGLTVSNFIYPGEPYQLTLW